MTNRMVVSTLLIAGLLLAIAPGSAQVADPAPIQDEAVEQLAELVVNGEQPGPPLWRVSSGDHALWLVGSVSQLPVGVNWRSRQLEAALSESQEVILDVGVASSPRTKAERRALNKAPNTLPGDKTLKDLLSPELHAEVEAARQSFASGIRGFERLRPFYAGNRLIMGSMRPLRLTPFGAMHTVSKLAAIMGVPVTRMVESEGVAQALLVDETSASTLPCLEAVVGVLQNEGAGVRALANAWAVGDIAALRQLVPLYDMGRTNPSMVQCDIALRGNGRSRSDFQERHRDKWLVAAERALAANKSTVAVIPMAEILAPDGYLARLRARGHEVVEPPSGRTTRVICPACSEGMLDAEESARSSAAMLAFNREVNAFSRYENGKTNPPLALVKLLKLLDRHPELLDEVRAT